MRSAASPTRCATDCRGDRPAGARVRAHHEERRKDAHHQPTSGSARSQEQARGSRQIAGALEAINGMVTCVSQAQRDYSTGSTEALRAWSASPAGRRAGFALAEISKIAATLTRATERRT